jgi:hypothetical protein
MEYTCTKIIPSGYSTVALQPIIANCHRLVSNFNVILIVYSWIETEID